VAERDRTRIGAVSRGAIAKDHGILTSR